MSERMYFNGTGKSSNKSSKEKISIKSEFMLKDLKFQIN